MKNLFRIRFIFFSILIIAVALAGFAYWCIWSPIVSSKRLAEIRQGTPLHEVVLKLGEPNEIVQSQENGIQLLSWFHPLKSSHLTVQINSELEVDWAYMDWGW